MKYWIGIIGLLLIQGVTYSQGYNIGIRAGIGQTLFSGPSEANATESYSLTGGFHFGMGFQWNFNEVLGIRSEVVYNQSGSNYNFDSEDGYILYRNLILNSRILDNTPRSQWPLIRDKLSIELDHSISYIQFPITTHVRISNHIDIYAGGYYALTLSPLATGSITFGEGDPREKGHILLNQGLDFNYDSDVAGQFNTSIEPIYLIVNDTYLDYPRTIGAYYHFESTDEYERKFKGSDYGLIGGFSYYFNRGLFLSLRMEYGLKDITRRLGDVSFQELNDDKTFVFNDDFDRNVGFYLSMGFKF